MKKQIVANWKMNTARAQAVALVNALKAKAGQGSPHFDLVICPPFVWLADCASLVAGSAMGLGAQDCHAAEKGAYTGDISAPMLKELGCSYVILGHSERRQHHQESSILVKEKATQAIKNGLVPIICVGEVEAERAIGQQEVIVARQLDQSIPDTGRFYIAYEPVWAIGTGKPPSLEDIRIMHDFIRNRIDPSRGVAILYGGSVKVSNAREILATKNVDGVLVGGASLDAEEFWGIAQASPTHKG